MQAQLQGPVAQRGRLTRKLVAGTPTGTQMEGLRAIPGQVGSSRPRLSTAGHNPRHARPWWEGQKQWGNGLTYDIVKPERLSPFLW
jgi:hypothetical protein